ncbi:hypothetical protein HCH52_04130 [Oscillospiraceae bacterium HV4-5-C5C]|nr:hypothetical protein [Oscillospiraceae bacterium HV4-5-C5C]
MELVGQTVFHQRFGCGEIKELKGQMLTVSFKDQTSRRFLYPDAFKTFLRLENDGLQQQVLKEAESSLKRQAREKAAQGQALRERVRDLESEQNVLRAKPPHQARLKHVVFKCDQPSGPDFVQTMEDGGFCLTLYPAGLPEAAARPLIPVLKIRQIHKDSLCVLTRRPDLKTPERERRVTALFLCCQEEADQADNATVLTAAPDFCLRFTPEEADDFYFWDIYANTRQPERVAWSSGRYRYLNPVVGALLLRRALKIKAVDPESADAVRAESFLAYYCATFGLQPEQLPDEQGALRLQQAAKLKAKTGTAADERAGQA